MEAITQQEESTQDVEQLQAPLQVEVELQEDTNGLKTDSGSEQVQSQDSQGPVKITTEIQNQARKAIEDYLADPKVSHALRQWADHFHQRFSGNWFTIDQIKKKTALKDVVQINDTLGMMILKGLVHREIRNKVLKYKVCLNASDKIKLLEGEIKILDERKALLNVEIERLKQGSADSQKN